MQLRLVPICDIALLPMKPFFPVEPGQKGKKGYAVRTAASRTHGKRDEGPPPGEL